MVFIFKFIFSDIMKARIEDYPFFIYLMTAIFPWSYFVTSVNAAVESIINNRELIKKTYFPRQIIPVSIVLASLINFLPSLIIMLLFLFFFRMQFTALLFLVPIVILLQTILTIGCVLIVSSLQVVLRDVKYIVELMLMVLLYLSPAFYPLTLIADFSKELFSLYILNPFVGIFILYRIAFLKGYAKTLPKDIDIFALSSWIIIVCLATFLLGFWVFKRYEKRFSDLI
jgi:ABC-type polysaccharide/polyol phosphate export permease